jgi:SM-20-related protein
MPGPAFFQSLGLYVVDGFLDREACFHIQSKMLSAPVEKGLIGRDELDQVLDERVRRVGCASLGPDTARAVKEDLLSIKPKLEEHFKISLGDCESPEFLLYGAGSFFRPHRDVSRCERSRASMREISIVVFLNESSTDVTTNTYRGGALTFHGLMSGPHWEECAFEFHAATGMLIAFPSNLLHEVRPVEFGQRFTIASWFRSKSEKVGL